MWFIPAINDFDPDNRVLSGIGKLNRSIFVTLCFFSQCLIEQVQHSKFQDQRLAMQLAEVLSTLLHYLECISMSFFTMHLGVRELQRAYLELMVLLNFEEHHCGRSDLSNIVSHNIMGAFTYDLAVCDLLYWAGVPVWLIRPHHELHSICIKSLQLLMKATNLIPLDPSTCPSYPSIYWGPGDVVDKYNTIWSNILKYPNPFGSEHAKPLQRPLPIAVPFQPESQAQCFTSCKFCIWIVVFC